MEKVIFRSESNPYHAHSYLAIFPDDPSNSGFVGCVPFFFDNGIAHFEPYTEISMAYYYKSKIIHKGTELSQKCLNAIQSRFDSRFTLAEKIMRR